MVKNNLNVGLSTTYEKVITPADTYVTKTVQVDNLMSTPSLLATIVEISWNMLKPYLGSDEITVVTNFQLNHMHPTIVGEKISFKMTIEGIENNRISLSYSGYDNKGEICNGTFGKAIVKKDKLLEDAIKRIKL